RGAGGVRGPVRVPPRSGRRLAAPRRHRRRGAQRPRLLPGRIGPVRRGLLTLPGGSRPPESRPAPRALDPRLRRGRGAVCEERAPAGGGEPGPARWLPRGRGGEPVVLLPQRHPDLHPGRGEARRDPGAGEGRQLLLRRGRRAHAVHLLEHEHLPDPHPHPGRRGGPARGLSARGHRAQPARTAQSLTSTPEHRGMQWLPAEDAQLSGDAQVITPESAWTGESNWRGAYVLAEEGGSVRFDLAGAVLEAVAAGGGTAHPVFHRLAEAAGTAIWAAVAADGTRTVLGALGSGGAGDPGATEWDGVLRPARLAVPLPAEAVALEVVSHGRL